MSQLNQILEQIAAIQKTIAGVTNAFAYQVSNTSELTAPFFVNEVLGGPSDLSGGMQQRIEDLVKMCLAIAPSDSDVTLANVNYKVITWRDVVYATFAGRVRLGNQLSFVLDARITRWGYEPRKTLGDVEWATLVFDVPVREWFPQTIAS